MKFLITGANGDIAISISRILRKHFKNSIIDGTDLENIGPGEIYYNNIFKVKKPNDKNYFQEIKELSKPYRIIIPTTENEIMFFSKNREKFKNKIILINSKFIINTFSSKIKTYKFLKNKRFSVPNFCIRLDNIKNYKNPFFIKLDYGHGNKNYRLINSKKKFNELKYLDKKKWVAQEFLDHKYDEYTCAIIKLQSFEDALILKRKLAKGYTYRAEVINNVELKNTLINLAKKINLCGSINVQLKINKNRFAIFEINPRLSSTVMMRNKMGFIDCIWWINYYLGKKLIKKKIKRNADIVKFFDEKFIN
tara:strand:- start:99 stop:1022 length:924 start_codon:yes stop_codon:yes gene_type:complete